MLHTQRSNTAASSVLCRNKMQDHEVTELPLDHGLSGIYGTL